ncbi:MAG: hypothetical protein ACPLZD_04990 [Candidatus Saccharicenans sp.]|nr:MAG: hypothetical protein C0168_02035 [Candidatus Aminicenantes bacterium]HEK85082.1 hypothetical protein [Candidatus Aminicenantes bacterium]
MKIERVEYYAGGCGEEKPLAVYIGGERLLVKEIISAKRILDKDSPRQKDIFECLLINGERVRVEKERE